MVQATVGTGTPRKHCWECQRRRLVCDSVRPVCNRCRNNGIVCPGYGEKKPLRWLKPGRVTTRNRLRPKDGSSSRVDLIQDNSNDSSSPMIKDASDTGELQRKAIELAFANAAKSTGLDSIMRYDITCDEPARVEASYIYGVELYNRLSPMTLLLEKNARIDLAPPAVTAFLPAPIKGLYILLALGHRMYKLPRDTGKETRTRMRSAVDYWAYQVVRTLNEQIALESAQVSPGTMAAVIMLLWEDQYRPSTRWRFHYNGLMKMTELHGGVRKLWDTSHILRNGIVMMAALETFANTTSPSHDQLSDLTHPRNLAFLQTIWENVARSIYVGSICPTALFTAILKINHLRALSITCLGPMDSISSPSSTEDNIIYNNAQTIIREIQAFFPSAYAERNGNERTRDKWFLVARIHQCAVVLYGILSLQSVFFLPETSALKRLVTMNYDQLLLDLKEGFKHGHLQNCLFWPLMVAGACAARGTAFERAFIADLLTDSVGDMGGAMPLLARATLMRFWASGKVRWDDCFDRPYIFIT
ncbi:hypothetical protein GGR50DRAFT_112423 [Xylaria sp. CBS 124048]|nr:hypothetical protein GGR50DRAFT_112423 [Xylaria sp. CBS 124048]